MVSITEEVAAAVVFDLSSFLAVRDIPCVAFSALWTFFVDVSVCAAMDCDILVPLFSRALSCPLYICVAAMAAVMAVSNAADMR